MRLGRNVTICLVCALVIFIITTHLKSPSERISSHSTVQGLLLTGMLSGKGENQKVDHLGEQISHYKEALEKGIAQQIPDGERLDSYAVFPPFDLWQEDISKIINKWKKYYPIDKVYQLSRHVVSLACSFARCTQNRWVSPSVETTLLTIDIC